MKIEEICEIEKDVSFKTLTSIKIGGLIKYVAHPKTIEQLQQLLKHLQTSGIKYYVLGNGTNVLATDKKYDGVIIKLNYFDKIYRRENIIYAGAGAGLNRVINYAIKAGLGGMEEGSGIPGSVGGGVIGNCGAHNFEMSKVIKDVWVLREGKLIKLSAKECGFGYRSSSFKPGDIILKASFELKYANIAKLKNKQKKVLEIRSAFPAYASMGSVFKRVEGVIVSKMLDEMGFKGLKSGKACVSKEHAGIIVNLGGAKAKNVKKLIKTIKNRVKKQKNIVLQEEIKYIE